MKRPGSLAAAVAVGVGSVSAQPWSFDPPIQVTEPASEVFHQLASSGRRSLAVSDGIVGVVWGDEREGTARAYLARKARDALAFSPPLLVSGDGEAFEPSILGLAGGRFAIAWEEDRRIRVRVVGPGSLGPTLELTPSGAQVTLAALDDGLVAVWSDREAGFGRIRVARLGLEGDLGLVVRERCPADADPPTADQLYPAAAAGDRLLVAWEDRRPGHTIIMATSSAPGQTCAFAPPRRVSADPPAPDLPYGAGHGVARVVLAPYGSGRALAAWEDKRRFRHGYDVYAAHFGPMRVGNAQDDRQPSAEPGPNERVQDAFGELAHQWHVTAAGHPDGTLVVAWTDEREGQGDILLSWYAGGEWSEDLPLPGASGPAEESHPTIVLDGAGRLHAAWVTREVKGGPTRINYALGRRAE